MCFSAAASSENDHGSMNFAEARDSWPDLPTGTIGAGRPIPNSHPPRTLSAEDILDLVRLLESGEENWLRRDRHRHAEIMAKIDRDAAFKHDYKSAFKLD